MIRKYFDSKIDQSISMLGDRFGREKVEAFLAEGLIGYFAMFLVTVMFGGYTVLLLFAYLTVTKGQERMGQFGDAFGFLTSLFTALGLIGLAFTVRLQWKQISEQAKASEEDRKSLLRQTREQYLTARLNSTVALLESYRAQADLAIARTNTRNPSMQDPYPEAEAERMIWILRRRLGILHGESTLGFDREWSLAVERDSIRVFFASILNEYLERSGGPNQVHESLSDPTRILQEAIREFSAIMNETRSSHSRIADYLNGCVGRMRLLLQDESKKNDLAMETRSLFCQLLGESFATPQGGDTYPWNASCEAEAPQQK